MSPIVIGHRGARGVIPENTLDGFAFCRAIGVTAIEFDVHVSAEGVPVVTHDPRPNPALVRDADGRWLDAPQPLICETPLARLKAWDVGALRPGSTYGARYPDQAVLGLCRIPTLAEVMEASPPETRLVIEIKSDPSDPVQAEAALTCARAVCALLEGHPLAAGAVIQSFDWRVLAVAREISPVLTRAYLTYANPDEPTTATVHPGSPWLTGPYLDDTAAMVAGQGGQIWASWHATLDAVGMAQARDAGLQVFVWTVNDPADIARMIDLGVDGIITDYPGRVQRMLAARAARG